MLRGWENAVQLGKLGQMDVGQPGANHHELLPSTAVMDPNLQLLHLLVVLLACHRRPKRLWKRLCLSFRRSSKLFEALLTKRLSPENCIEESLFHKSHAMPRTPRPMATAPSVARDQPFSEASEVQLQSVSERLCASQWRLSQRNVQTSSRSLLFHCFLNAF